MKIIMNFVICFLEKEREDALVVTNQREKEEGSKQRKACKIRNWPSSLLFLFLFSLLSQLVCPLSPSSSPSLVLLFSHSLLRFNLIHDPKYPFLLAFLYFGFHLLSFYLVFGFISILALILYLQSIVFKCWY